MHQADEPQTIVLQLAPSEAWALAQLCKRFRHDLAVELSDRKDNGVERDAMLISIDRLRTALAEAGFAPR
jgi:hypothetical protein